MRSPGTAEHTKIHETAPAIPTNREKYPTFELTGEQRNSLLNQIERPAAMPDFARTGPAHPDVKVLVVNFDGTRNDRAQFGPCMRRSFLAFIVFIACVRQRHSGIIFHDSPVGCENAIALGCADPTMTG